MRRSGSIALPMPVHPKDELQSALPLDPVLRSADDVADALYELAWMASRERTVNAALQQRIDLLRKESAAKLELQFGRTSLTYADRRQRLEQAIRDFAAANHGEVFDQGSKTRQFACGKLSLRAQPESLQFVDEGKDAEAAIIAKIEKKAKLGATIVEKVLGILRRMKLWSGSDCRATDLLQVTVRIDKQGAKSAYKAGKITEQQFEQLGLTINRPADKLSIDVGDLPVSSESRQPAEAAA